MKIFKKILEYCFHFLAAVLLTVATQVGGLLYLLAIAIYKIVATRNTRWAKKRYAVGIFTVIYLAISLFITPYIAPLFGRVPLPYFQHQYVKPNTAWIWLMNRHYVEPELLEATYIAAGALQYHGRR